MLSEQQSQLPLEATEKQQDLETKWGEDVSFVSAREGFLLDSLAAELTWISTSGVSPVLQHLDISPISNA